MLSCIPPTGSLIPSNQFPSLSNPDSNRQPAGRDSGPCLLPEHAAEFRSRGSRFIDQAASVSGGAVGEDAVEPAGERRREPFFQVSNHNIDNFLGLLGRKARFVAELLNQFSHHDWSPRISMEVFVPDACEIASL